MSASPSSRWGDLTWPEAGALRGAIGLLPCGAVEAHGPHLPLLTDVVIAESAASKTCERLRDSGSDAVVLPPLAYAVADYAAGLR